MAPGLRRAFGITCALFLIAAGTAFGDARERSAQARGVTGSAEPLNLSDAGASTIQFKVALDTHTYPLTFDMAKIARLGDGSKTTEAASAWSGGKGGHHLMGILTFPAAGLRNAKTLVLTLTGAGGGSDLSFAWKAPF